MLDDGFLDDVVRRDDRIENSIELSFMGIVIQAIGIGSTFAIHRFDEDALVLRRKNPCFSQFREPLNIFDFKALFKIMKQLFLIIDNDLRCRNVVLNTELVELYLIDQGFSTFITMQDARKL